MYKFEDLAQDIENVVNISDSFNEIINQGAKYLRNLINNRSLLSEQEIISIAHGYTDSFVYRSSKNGFVIQVFAWGGKSRTNIHDHRTWGLMGIYKNKLGITEYSLIPLERHRTYDLTESQDFIAGEGDVCYILPPGEEIHKVYNPTDELSISIHIYGKQIDKYNVYDIKKGRIFEEIV